MKLVHKKQGVPEMFWLPVKTIVLQGTGKIIHNNLGGDSKIFVQERESFIPAFSIWHDVMSIQYNFLITTPYTLTIAIQRQKCRKRLVCTANSLLTTATTPVTTTGQIGNMSL